MTQTSDTTQTTTTTHTAAPAVTHNAHTADTLSRADALAMDSVAMDSLRADSLLADSLAKVEKANKEVITVPVRPDWWHGIRPVERHFDASRDPSMMGLIVMMFLVIAFSFKHFTRIFSTLFKELVSTRSRSEVFDEHTSSYGRLIAIMIFQTIVFTGMAGAMALNELIPGAVAESQLYSTTLWMILLSAGIYFFQLLGYKAVGYSFTKDESARQWVRGFNASMSLLGFPLALITVVMVLYPAATEITLILSGGLFIIAKILFIYKGFRIFYNKFPSLLYFILYLCTLEITPLLIVFQIALKIIGA